MACGPFFFSLQTWKDWLGYVHHGLNNLLLRGEHSCPITSLGIYKPARSFGISKKFENRWLLFFQSCSFYRRSWGLPVVPSLYSPVFTHQVSTCLTWTILVNGEFFCIWIFILSCIRSSSQNKTLQFSSWSIAYIWNIYSFTWCCSWLILPCKMVGKTKRTLFYLFKVIFGWWKISC